MASVPERRRTSVLAWALAVLLLTTGTDHFLSPSGFEAIVPRFLGSPALWVRASGVAELAVAVGLAVRRTRRAAAIAAVILFVAVFPANIKMALDSGSGRGWTNQPWVAWGRLPLQIPLVIWAAWISRTTSPTRARSVGRLLTAEPRRRSVDGQSAQSREQRRRVQRLALAAEPSQDVGTVGAGAAADVDEDSEQQARRGDDE